MTLTPQERERLAKHRCSEHNPEICYFCFTHSLIDRLEAELAKLSRENQSLFVDRMQLINQVEGLGHAPRLT